MPHQIDLVGSEPQPKPFRDIRNTRDEVAERKARLCLQLGMLMNKVPPKVANGSVQMVRKWRHDREAAAKVAKSSRSSVGELSSAINKMESYL